MIRQLHQMAEQGFSYRHGAQLAGMRKEAMVKFSRMQKIRWHDLPPPMVVRVGRFTGTFRELSEITGIQESTLHSRWRVGKRGRDLVAPVLTSEQTLQRLKAGSDRYWMERKHGRLL